MGNKSERVVRWRDGRSEYVGSITSSPGLYCLQSSPLSPTPSHTYYPLIGALLPCANQMIGMHYFSPLGEDASAGDHHHCPDLKGNCWCVCVCVCGVYVCVCICCPFLLDSAFYFNFTLSIQASTSYIVTSCHLKTGQSYT